MTPKHWQGVTARAPFHPGIYVVYAGEKVLYVGCAKNLSNRLQKHDKLTQLLQAGATEVRWYQTEYGVRTFGRNYCTIEETDEQVRLRFRIEAEVIAALRPAMNQKTPVLREDEKLLKGLGLERVSSYRKVVKA